MSSIKSIAFQKQLLLLGTSTVELGVHCTIPKGKKREADDCRQMRDCVCSEIRVFACRFVRLCVRVWVFALLTNWYA